jgi:hypothetical protein
LKTFLILKRLQSLKQEWQESPAGTRQTDGKNLIWFGELERKLAMQIIKDFFLFFLPLNYFMVPSNHWTADGSLLSGPAAR